MHIFTDVGMGGYFNAHSMYFLTGAAIISVVAETAKAVWDYLHSKFMPIRTRQKWREVSQMYQEL
jgi:hypothetical protein